MTAQHTPGPWRWWLCKDGSYNVKNDYVQLSGRPEHVAQIRVASVSEADLRLIAAAPELLEALQVMLRDYAAVHDVGDVEMQPAIYQANAAIQKATNKEQA